MSTKKGHVIVVEVPYNRRSLRELSLVEDALNSAVGNRNVDWYVHEYYAAQYSVIRFTVPSKLKHKALVALR